MHGRKEPGGGTKFLILMAGPDKIAHLAKETQKA